MKEGLIREKEMEENKTLLEEARKELKGKRRLIPSYPEAYWKAKEILNGSKCDTEIEDK